MTNDDDGFETVVNKKKLAKIKPHLSSSTTVSGSQKSRSDQHTKLTPKNTSHTDGNKSSRQSIHKIASNVTPNKNLRCGELSLCEPDKESPKFLHIGKPEPDDAVLSQENGIQNSPTLSNIISGPDEVVSASMPSALKLIAEDRVEANPKTQSNDIEINKNLSDLTISQSIRAHSNPIIIKPRFELSPLDFSVQLKIYEILNERRIMDINVAVSLPRGIINNGNTCFLNVILQLLMADHAFSRIMLALSRDIDNDDNFSASISIWNKYISLISNTHNISPQKLLKLEQQQKQASTLKTTTSSTKSRLVSDIIDPDLYIFDIISAFRRQANTCTTSSTVSKNSIVVKEEGSKPQLSVFQGMKGKGNTSEDAMEFLTYFLDLLHESLMQVDNNDVIHNLAMQCQVYMNEPKTTELVYPKLLQNFTDNLVIHNSTLVENIEKGIDLKPLIKRILSRSKYHVLVDEGEMEQDIQGQDDWNTVAKAGLKKAVVCNESKRAAIKLNASTVISRLFHGTMRSEVQYLQKKLSSVTFQRFHCISLDIINLQIPSPTAAAVVDSNKISAGKNKSKSLQPATTRSPPPAPSIVSKLTIMGALDKYFEVEMLDEGRIKKGVCIECPPSILILHIKRFSFDFYRNIPIKVKTDVSYELELNLPERYLSQDLQQQLRAQSGGGRGIQYELVSVVLHHGAKATGGHYTCYCRHNDGSSDGCKWYYFDDQKVFESSVKDVLDAREEVYILAYRRKE